MFDVDKAVREFRSEADRDFIWLWQIASDVQHELGRDDQREIRANTLKVARGLMMLNVLPGDYSFMDTSFRFWSGTTEEHLDQMENKWIAMGVTPNAGDPVCCFSLRPSHAVDEPVWVMGEWSCGKAG